MASSRAAPRRAPPFIDPPGYVRHRPGETLLYQFVEKHYAAFVAARAAAGRPLPGHVQAEFEAYLKCGRFEHGFLRVQCGQCHAETPDAPVGAIVAGRCRRASGVYQKAHYASRRRPMNALNRLCSEPTCHAQHEIAMAAVQRLECASRFVTPAPIADCDELFIAAAIDGAHSAS
jgi:hypothetical protein